MAKSPKQKLLEMEEKVKLLEKQKAELEKKLDFTDKKSILIIMMIDKAEQEFKNPYQKKVFTQAIRRKRIASEHQKVVLDRQKGMLPSYNFTQKEESSCQAGGRYGFKSTRANPRLGTRKLNHKLYKALKELSVGRDMLFK